MDLLGSIMSSMDKPPSLSEAEKNLIKKKKAEIEKNKELEKEKLNRFKERVETKFDNYFKDKKNVMLKFEPMDQIYRSIVHEVADSKGLLSYAFGVDGVDRYIRVYRKENAPSADEIAARKRGEPWNDFIQQQLIEKREQERLMEEEYARNKKNVFVPNYNYKDKYAHLIGQEAALDAAKKTETNQSYGFVPSKNKKDSRSIEQTMADIKAKKRQKLCENEEDLQQ
ncbi:sperm-associated antigen 7 homolog [Aethina tumida]|uniref:sperm-associated antigen 7 homolog n=1 Tax=Aethina tumida TaxID=116153 RepID=UPI00096B0625|nr:sperm-associated antigen 7 homolog [Aethina tumida]